MVGGHDPDDPAFEVSGQITIVGDKGYFDSVHGKGFYELMRQSGREIMQTLGIKTLEGDVLPAHARLMRAALAGVGEVRATDRAEIAGHEAIRIQVTPTADSDADVTLDLHARPV